MYISQSGPNYPAHSDNRLLTSGQGSLFIDVSVDLLKRVTAGSVRHLAILIMVIHYFFKEII